MTTTATLTPFASAESSKIGSKTYRKQVLPLGSIQYQGRTISFDKEFLSDIAKSFRKGAYEQVPFVLADASNAHNMDPERFRGEVVGLELSDSGLDMVVSVNAKGQQILKDNPRLGVSARIVENLAKADGRSFKRAIQHVLGTMNPRVSGLGPWQAVDLAEDEDTDQTLDLTDQTYEEQDMAKRTGADELDLSTLSDEDFLALVELADVDGDVDDEDDEDDQDDEDESDDESPVDTGESKKIALVVDTDEDDEDDDTDLSDVLGSDARAQLHQMRVELAEEKFKNERKSLMLDGVPRVLIDLAEPFLNTPDEVIVDLSDDDSNPLNASDTIRQMLDTFKGMVDLSPEDGHAIELADNDKQKSRDDAMLAEWEEQFPI